jgi:hypothetical protein
MFQRLALFLLAAAPLAAQDTLFNHVPDPRVKTRVEAVALFSQPSPGGYLPVRITVVNASPKPGAISIATECNDSGYGGRGSEITSSFDLSIPAEGTSVHDLLVPCTTMLNFTYAGRQNVTLRMSGTFGGAVGSMQAGYSPDQPAVLLSEPLYTPNASMLDSAMAASGSRHGYGSSTFAAKFDARNLPEDWRAYSGYDGIGMTDTDWGNATPGARNAILRWNRLGGELIIYTLSPSSDLASLGIAEEGKGVRSADRSFGRVSLLPVQADMKLDPAETVRQFGAARLKPLSEAIQQDYGASWPLKSLFGNEGYSYGLFIVILIAFGILVGPVNLFVFAKSGRRHRLFITTPLIALGTSLLLVALIVLIDGFGGRGMRAVLMEVRPDDGENSAYVMQEQISRTGVLLGGGFTVGEPAVVTPVPLEATQWSRLTQDNGGGGMRYESLLRDGKLQVDGDWFQSRSEQGHFLRAVVPTRGRIEARNAAGAPSFMSTFEFPVETLYFLDSSGGVWKAAGITPGKAFTCEPSDLAELKAFAHSAWEQLSDRSRALFDRRASDALYSRPGHFVAVTDAAPGIGTLEGIDWSRTRTIITGPIAKP